MAAAVLSPGCAAQVRDERATGVIADADWPPRLTAGLTNLAAATPDVLVPEPSAALANGERQDGSSGAENAVRIVRRAVCGCGVVLELEPVASDDSAGSDAETELAFVSFSPMAHAAGEARAQRAGLPDRITWDDVQAGVAWKLYEPRTSSARGLIVHLGGNKYVRRALLKSGYAVLHSSGTGRYLQRRAFNPVFRIEPRTDLARPAGELARVFDDELADWPYSLEAVLEYLARYRPEITQQPAAAMGFSIGALGLPAVVARMPGRFQAAVFVAGGANLFEIARLSRKEHRGIVLEWSGADPTPDDWRQLSAAYLAQVKLDPYQAAAALRNVPVAMYHAQLDRVVPAATGETLYARLGKPERSVFPVGHGQLLRIVMRLQAGAIVEWVDAALHEAPAPSTRTAPTTAGEGSTP